MSFHQPYPGGRSHQAPGRPSFTPLPLNHRPIPPAPRMAAPTASSYDGYPYMTSQLNPMSSANPSQSSPAAVATYSRLTTGQFLQQSIPPNNPTEEFTGSITVMIPALFVLVVIGINGETIRTIQKNSGAIRIHIHDPPHGVDLGDMVIPRRCQIWGTKGATTAAKQEIEKIISSNRMSLLDSGSMYRARIRCLLYF